LKTDIYGKIRDDVATVLTEKRERICLIDANHRDKPELDAIRLATMHRAKGLEFDRVVVLVSTSVLDNPDADETDMKMLYVALTRAKREAQIIAY
jgi:superfamily I DNA/RNA helicase